MEFKSREIPWDHENDSFQKAVGVTDEEIQTAIDKMNAMIKDVKESGEAQSHSRFYQMLLENFDPLIALMILETTIEQRIKSKAAEAMLMSLLSE